MNDIIINEINDDNYTAWWEAVLPRTNSDWLWLADQYYDYICEGFEDIILTCYEDEEYFSKDEVINIFNEFDLEVKGVTYM